MRSRTGACTASASILPCIPYSNNHLHNQRKFANIHRKFSVGPASRGKEAFTGQSIFAEPYPGPVNISY